MPCAPHTRLAVVALAALSIVAFRPVVAAPNQTISGKVLDDQGQGLDGVLVTVRGEPKDPTLTVTTKKKGTFFFGLVKADYDYTLAFEADDLSVRTFTAKTYDHERKLQDEFTVAGEPGAQLRAVRVPVGGSVVVEVVLARSAAVADAILGQKLKPALDHIEAGEWAEAGAVLDGLLQQMPDEPRLLYLKGFTLLRGGDPAAALPMLEAAAAAAPDLPGVHAAAGAALAETGRYAEAEAAFALEAEGTADVATRVNARIGQSEAARKRGDDQAALAALEQALAIDPSRPDIYTLMAEAYTRLGQQDKAEEIVARGESAGSGDPVALYNLAARFMNEGAYEKALTNFRKAVALDPGLTHAHYHMGIALINLQRVDEAREELQAFLDTNPEGPDAENARAIVEMLPPSEPGS